MRLRLHGLDSDAWARYRTAGYRPSLAREAGLKYNWTDLQAAIGLAQLEKLEGFLATRENLAERYDGLIRDVDGVQPVDRGPSGLEWRHALHLYQVAVAGSPPRRDRVITLLQANGIGAAIHYIGVNHDPTYRSSETYPGKRLGIRGAPHASTPPASRRGRTRAGRDLARAGARCDAE